MPVIIGQYFFSSFVFYFVLHWNCQKFILIFLVKTTKINKSVVSVVDTFSFWFAHQSVTKSVQLFMFVKSGKLLKIVNVTLHISSVLCCCMLSKVLWKLDLCVQFLLEVARQKNQTPLPLIKPYTGPRLPPDRYCLTAPNYRLKSVQKKVKTLKLLLHLR